MPRGWRFGLGAIGAGFAEFEAARGAASGELRLNVAADANRLLVGPVLAAFRQRLPDTCLTAVVENRPADMVAEGFDAGIRYGDIVPEDMVAMTLIAPLEWVVVEAPAYLDAYGRPLRPGDLAGHDCLQLLLGNNAPFGWELGSGAAMVRVDVPGTCTIAGIQTYDRRRCGRSQPRLPAAPGGRGGPARQVARSGGVGLVLHRGVPAYVLSEPAKPSRPAPADRPHSPARTLADVGVMQP